jgi:hypothetical protein
VLTRSPAGPDHWPSETKTDRQEHLGCHPAPAAAQNQAHALSGYGISPTELHQYPNKILTRQKGTGKPTLRGAGGRGCAGRRCLRSYLDSAAAHGITVSSTIDGKPWLTPLPAIA